MISYAQNAEDVVLDRAFADMPGGFYIDAGAFHPTIESVTKHFYDRGWSGINIEPDPQGIVEFGRTRPRDINLNIGLSNAPTTLTFHRVVDAPGLSTFDDEMLTWGRADGSEIIDIEVPVRTLSQVCREWVASPIDFLKVDTEGFEQQVLAGADWDRFRPRAVLVERGFHPDTWIPILEAAGYVQTLYDGINVFFVREEESDTLGARLSEPATITLDEFDPYRYIQPLDAATNEIAQLRKEIADLQRSVRSTAEQVSHRLGTLAYAAGRRASAMLRPRNDC